MSKVYLVFEKDTAGQINVTLATESATPDKDLMLLAEGIYNALETAQQNSPGNFGVAPG